MRFLPTQPILCPTVLWFHGSVVTPGSAGSLSCWGQSLCSQRTPLLSYQSQEGTGAGLQVTAVSCKPETLHSSSFRAGRAPPQQTPARNSPTPPGFLPSKNLGSPKGPELCQEPGASWELDKQGLSRAWAGLAAAPRQEWVTNMRRAGRRSLSPWHRLPWRGCQELSG